MIGTKFTPGPWEVYEYGEFCTIDKQDSVSHVSGICTLYRSYVEEVRSNAALISTAPEMYEALSEAVELYGKPGGPWNVPGDPGSWIAKAKAALKKAKG